MKPLHVPAPLRPFTKRPWPAIGLLVASFVVLWVYALPQWTDASETLERAALQRELVERQAELAAEGPAQEARSAALVAWWQAGADERVRARTLEAATAALLDEVRQRCESAGARVGRLERNARSDVIAVDPPAEVVSVRLQINADRMEHLAGAIGALESSTAPWLRIGNMTLTRQPYRDLAGVQAEMTVYACLEATGG